MSKETLRKVLFAVVIVLMLVGSFFIGRMQIGQTNVLAQEIPEDGTRASASFTCTINQVAIYSDRAHIKCASPAVVGTDNVYWFAIANTSENEMFINRVMAIGLTNMSMDRTLYIWYDTSSTNNPPGCQTSDCRKLLAATGQK